MDALINSLIQVGVFIGGVYFVGFLISLINRLFYSLAGTSGAVVYGTGFIGTPIHELSHAFFCLVFGHKITEIKLFQIDDEDGTLGYVNHSYNPRNIYHQIGNFFIGTAPILVGTVFLMLLMWLITPNTFNGINALLSANLGYKDIGMVMWGGIKVFFSGVSDWRWWLYLIPVILIAIHMNLSKADLRGTVVAIPLMIIVIFAVNFIIYLISKDAYASFNSIMVTGEVYLILILFMSLVFSLISLVPALIIYFIRRATGNV